MAARASITLNAELSEFKEHLSFGSVHYGDVDPDICGEGFYTEISVPVNVDGIEAGTVRMSAHVYYHSEPLDKSAGKSLYHINGYDVRMWKCEFIGTLAVSGADEVVIHLAKNYVKDRDVVTHVDLATYDTLMSSLPKVGTASKQTLEKIMEDVHSRAYGLAHSAILAELLRALINSNTLSASDVLALLTNAGQVLASKGTDVAAAATEHVKLIGEAVGVSPSPTGSKPND
ncbi:MAG: hypothetical protein ACLQFI_15155 [Methylocella sp.]